jgi:hypothetical protein
MAVKSVSEIPDFRSDGEIAEWYETHSTVLIQDQLESVAAQVGGKLRSRLMARRRKNQLPELATPPHRSKR